MTDPIADFLTRIRNALGARHQTCELQSSKMKEQLARILLEEGYIADWSVQGDGARRTITLKLKYGAEGSQVIRGLRRISRPGRRYFAGSDEIPKVLNGLGISIVSTSSGIITDSAARKLGVGGEVLCSVW